MSDQCQRSPARAIFTGHGNLKMGVMSVNAVAEAIGDFFYPDSVVGSKI